MSDIRERTRASGKEREGGENDGEPARIRVEDRRHWAREDRGDEDAAPSTTVPTVVDEYRARAEAAEERLREYIAAFKQAEADQEAFRARLRKDVERRVEMRFAEVVEDLVEPIDDLDLAAAHAGAVPEAAALAEGVRLVRERVVAALARHGVVPIHPDGEAFDPNVAEAVRVDPVDDPARDGIVTATLRPGYRLGDRIVRPAKVAVGKTGS